MDDKFLACSVLENEKIPSQMEYYCNIVNIYKWVDWTDVAAAALSGEKLNCDHIGQSRPATIFKFLSSIHHHHL